MSSPSPTKLTISINPNAGMKPAVGKSKKGPGSGVEISISDPDNAENSVSLDMAQLEKNKGFSMDLGTDKKKAISVSLGPKTKDGLSVSMNAGEQNNNVSVKLRSGGQEKDITDLVETKRIESSGISVDKVGDQKFCDIVNLLGTQDENKEYKVKAFQISKVCPNIVSLLANQVRVPVSQRKAILPTLEERLNKKVNIRNNDEFYLSFLNAIEADLGVIAIFLNTIIPQQKVKAISPEHYFSKAADDFSPVKLAIKTYLRRGRLLSTIQETGLTEISELDRLGIIFYYGFHYGITEYIMDDSTVEEEVETEEVEETIEVETKEEDKIEIPEVIQLNDFISKLETIYDDNSDDSNVRFKLAKNLFDSATCLLFSHDPAVIKKLQSIVDLVQDWHDIYQLEQRTKDVLEKIESTFGHKMSFKVKDSNIMEKIEEIVTESEDLVAQFHSDTFQLLRMERILAKTDSETEQSYVNSLQTKISELREQIKNLEAQVQSNWKSFYLIVEPILPKPDISEEKKDEVVADSKVESIDQQADEKKDVDDLKLEEVQVKEESAKDQDGLDLKSTEPQPAEKSEELKQAKDVISAEPQITEDKVSPIVTKEQIEFDTGNQKILAELIKEDFLAIAKQFALALRRSGSKCEIPHEVLDFAAGCRISFESYDSSTNIFQNRLESAFKSADDNPSANLILFGSLLRPAILQPSTMVRERIGQLSLGPFSNSVSDLAIYLAQLDFSFSPTLNDLATFAGRSADSRQSQIEEELAIWVDNTLKRHGPCQPSTMVVHRLVRAGGDFGKIIELIKNGNIQQAEASARTLIEEFKSHDDIYSSLKDRNQVSDSKAREFPTLTLLYIYRRIDEGRDLLAKWLQVISKDSNKGSSHSADQKKITVKLETLATEAMNKLEEVVKSTDPITSALGFWIRYQIEDTCELLRGKIAPTWGDFDTARNEELDLLPIMTALEDNQVEIEAEDKATIEYLRNEVIPSVEDAVQAHIDNGAFRKAARLVHWLDPGTSRDELRQKITDTRQHQIDQVFGHIDQKMKLLREIDAIELLTSEYIEQCLVELNEILENLQIDRSLELDSIASTTVTKIPTDVDEVTRFLNRIDQKIATARQTLISTHERRIGTFSNVQSEDVKRFADNVKNVELFGLTNLEDKIARIRDGRAIEFQESRKASSLAEYLNDFASNSGKNGWPSNYREYDIAFRNNPLFTATKERRDRAREIMQVWFDIETSLMSDESAEFKLKEFLQNFGIFDVVLRKGTKQSDSKLWLHTGFLRISSDSEMFIPPRYGSESNNFFNVIVMHNSVPIEEVITIIDSNAPTIVIAIGQLIENTRRDLTYQLRQNCLNALVIDETLAGYLAIRADNEFKSLLECGFAIGNINSYEIISKEETPPELFYGREFEIQKIISPESDGVFIYGGRNAGKSAILSQISTRFHDPDNSCYVLRSSLGAIELGKKAGSRFLAHFAESIPSDIIDKSATDVSNFDELVNNLKEWVKGDKSRRLVCLFDDCDAFLDSEFQNNFECLLSLKQLMVDTDYAVKLVFSGSLKLQRYYNSLNSVMNKIGSPLCIGQLNRTKDDLEKAYQMIVEPMQLAGFEFSEKETATSILSQLSYFPSLIQSFGVELLNHLNSQVIDAKNGPPWQLSHETLLIGRELLVEKQQIRDKFREMLDADPRYKLVAYAMGYIKWEEGKEKVVYEGLSADEILNVLDEYWPKQLEKLVAAELQVILDELVEIGMLGKFESNGEGVLYCFRTNQLAKLVGSENRMIEELLSMEEIEPNQSYDPLVTRRLLTSKENKGSEKNAQVYSPLTDFQIHQLIDNENASSIGFVVGTEAMGIYEVSDAISDYVVRFGSIIENNDVTVEIAPNLKQYLDLLKSTPKSKSQSSIVVFAPKDKIPEDLSGKLDNMDSLKSGQVKTLIVVNASIPSQRKLVKGQGAMYLRPWGGEMVKSYLENLEIPSDVVVLNSILTKTGGIPTEVMKIVAQIDLKDNAETIAKKVDDKGKPAQFPLDKKYVDAVAILANISGMVKDSNEPQSEIYKLANDEVSKNVGSSLEDIGQDLMSFGILEQFDPAKKFYRVSKLGRFVARQSE